MKRWRTSALPLLLLFAALLLSAGCTSLSDSGALVEPPKGFLFTSQRAPLWAELPLREPIERLPGAKMGSATASSIVLPFTYGFGGAGWGSMAMVEAARNGGIQKIHYSDYEMFSILGIYNRMTVFVYGQ